MGDWVVTECWGQNDDEEETGDVCHTVTDSYQQARHLLEQINLRQQDDGFERQPDREEQLPLDL